MLTNPQSPPARQKMIFVAQHPIHYHAAIYRRAAADPELDCDVYFMQKAWAADGYEPEFGQSVDWGIPITDGYPHRYFRNISPKADGTGFFKFVNLGMIWKVLTGPRAIVYVHGMNYFTHLGCIVAAFLSGKPLVLRSITYDVTKSKGAKGAFRDFIYRLIFKLPRRFLYIGTHNAQFFRNHGVPDRKLFYAPHIVDNAFFSAKAAALKPSHSEIKARFGIASGQKVVTFVGKLTRGKQCNSLISAFADAALGPDWTLVIVGTGAEWDALHVQAAGLPLRIVFTGFLDQNELCDVYSITDIFVLPSQSETWGLVINEAMNFGCAIVASDKVGCAPDLVEGKSGLVFPSEDAAALASVLRRLALDGGFRNHMQTNALGFISEWSVDHYLAGLKRATCFHG